MAQSTTFDNISQIPALASNNRSIPLLIGLAQLGKGEELATGILLPLRLARLGDTRTGGGGR